MKKVLFFITVIVLLLSCGTITVDPFIASADAGDFSLALANGEFATSGFLFYRLKAGTSVEEYFEIIPPPFKGDISIKAIGCGDKETNISSDGSMNPMRVNFSDVVTFDTWPDQETCEIFISGKFSVTVKTETKVQIANALIKLIVFDSTYEPLPLKSPYSSFSTKYKGQEVEYSTKLRGAVESPLPPIGGGN